MADEREGEELKGGSPANENKLQTQGREANAAQPLNEADDNGGAERYPETRSFTQGADDADSGAGTDASVSANEGRLGRGADPAEGKR